VPGRAHRPQALSVPTEQTPFFALHVMRMLANRLRMMNTLT
jgi:hypothetical protein